LRSGFELFLPAPLRQNCETEYEI